MKTNFIKIVTCLFSLLLILTLATTAFGQDEVKKKTDQYKKTTKRKTERRVDRKVDDAIDGGLDAIFNRKKRKKKKEKELEEEYGHYETEQEENTYYELKDAVDLGYNEFSGSFQMNFTTERDGREVEEESGADHYYFSRFQSAVRPAEKDKTDVTVIYDLQEKTMTTVKNKVAIIIDKPTSKKPALNASDINVRELSSTRSIDGYECKKFVIETPNDLITMWVNTELQYNFDLIMLSVDVPSKKEMQKISSGYTVYGIPMEITVESLKRDENIKMNITDLKVGNPDQKVFDLSGCDVTDMSN